MKASILLLLACAAVLAAGARADAPGEPEALVRKVQEYAQKVKSAFSSLQESEAAQQARRWLSDNTDLVKQRLAWLKEQLAELWKRTPAV
ncbi:APOC3 protein, partial [Halcyon senegalensis]|nr:APOC3 protein [Halcyon senegalensis]